MLVFVKASIEPSEAKAVDIPRPLVELRKFQRLLWVGKVEDRACPVLSLREHGIAPTHHMSAANGAYLWEHHMSHRRGFRRLPEVENREAFAGDDDHPVSDKGQVASVSDSHRGHFVPRGIEDVDATAAQEIRETVKVTGAENAGILLILERRSIGAQRHERFVAKRAPRRDRSAPNHHAADTRCAVRQGQTVLSDASAPDAYTRSPESVITNSAIPPL